MGPINSDELARWWEAYCAALAGGSPARTAKHVALAALKDYREQVDVVQQNETNAAAAA